jgi:microtubule-associated protein-like 6
LRIVNFNDVWETFLSGTFTSFALTPAEMQSVLSDAVSNAGKSSISKEALNSAIKDYISLVEILSETDTSKVFDVMAVCSSILLLSQTSLEMKIDQLFCWITLDPESHGFSYEDFLVAMRSFERGLSHAFGRVACSEGFVKEIAAQWMAVADPQRKGLADANARISTKNFFDFCVNRQFVVRRLLEALASLEVLEDKNLELQEVTDTVDLYREPGGGDEWMANPAWKKTAERMVTKAVRDRYVNAKPSSNLELDWVHGYRGFDCRNNLRYADMSGRQIIYSAAALGIILDQNDGTVTNRKQHFFSEHGDDIICLTSVFCKSANNEDISLIASGEIGKSPAIYLYAWNSADKSFQSLACLKGFHKKGVAQIAFSKDASRLFSIGVEYSIAVYDTRIGSKSFGKMISSSQGPKDRICHVSDCGSTGKFISCGEKHAIMWTLDANNMLKQELIKLGTNKNKTFLSSTSVIGGGALMATADGNFFFATGNTCTPATLSKGSSMKGHGNVAINALWSNDTGDMVVSGDKDGHIVVWRVAAANTMAIIYEFDLTGYHISSHADGLINAAAGGTTKGKIDNIKAATTPPPAIRSVCMDPNKRKILVGTQTCEIIECALPAGVTFSPTMTVSEQLSVQGENLVSGHYLDEVWGLAVRPITPENRREGTQYATVGDDGFLRLWSVERRQALLCVDLKQVARTCAYSPDGIYLAVGFGGGSKKNKAKDDGMVKIFRIDRTNDTSAIHLTQVSEIKEAKQWISVLRYSPDGSTLAVGARDNSIYLYSVANQYKRKAKFSKHNAGINQLDFTADGKYLQSCCSAYEILFSDTSNGAQVTDGATKLLEVEWHTWTCTLGWPVIGIWSGSMDGSDINNVDRSPSKKYLATCDDFGYVNLFRNPCIHDKGADHNKYNGHSSHVTCVRWASVYRGAPDAPFRALKTDDYLISTGGEDKCVFQWRHTDTGDDRPTTLAESTGLKEEATVANDEIGLPTGGDEFMAVKPYLGAIVPPTAWKTPNPQRIPPFQAALGEFGNQHRALNEALENSNGEPLRNRDEIYTDLMQSADNVLQRMYDSGVVDHSLPNHDDLELEWVYGYNGYDCRNNIHYVSPSSSNNGARFIVYHAAALGILVDLQQKRQRYFRGHNDDITAMCVFEKKSGEVVEQTLVATGQIGMGNVYVWEAPSLQTLSVLPTKQKTVLLITFSADGRYLVSFGEDQSVVISDWKSQTILANAKADGGRTYDIAMLRTVDGKQATITQFLAAGDKTLKLWTVNGRNVTSAKYTAGKFTSTQQFLSCVEMASIFYVGCESGDIYVIPSKEKEVKDSFPHNPTRSSSGKAKAGGKAAKGAAGSVTAMATTVKGNHRYLLSGSKDGVISIFDADRIQAMLKADHLFSFEITTVLSNIIAKQIQSINVNTSITSLAESQLLVVIGTRGCDIIEVLLDLSAKSAVLYQDRSRLSLRGIIMQAHCNDELWGVASHPTKPEFCSVGDDKTLRFWDLSTRTMKKCVPLGNISRTCCYNQDGSLLALGFGGRVGRGKETGGGMVRLYRVALETPEGATKVCERQDAKQWISDVKFSQDGSTLVAGAHDCKIYIYTVNMSATGKELSLRCTFMKHAAVINHLDLSFDGRFMQSNCSGYELLFCDITNGKQITSPQEVKDVKWHTWTCTLGWPVQGIWAPGLDGSDINMVSRSHSGHLLATSDDNGKVNLYRYPTLDPKEAKPLTFSGHSSHVMNIRWTCGDECLISAGGNDKCLFQWRHRMAEMSMNSSTISTSTGSSKSDRRSGKNVRIALTASSSGAQSDGEDDDDDDNASVKSEGTVISAASSIGDAFGGLDLLDGPSGGDESGAVKPWIGAVKPPKNPPPYSDKAPAVECKLSWIQGYSSSLSSCRPNLFYNLNGQLVYPAAALAVLLDRGASTQAVATAAAAASGLEIDRRQWQQIYFEGHDDDVTCLTMSRDRRFVATGQIASKALKGKASVIVWDALQGRLLSRMEGCHQRGVYSVAFSPDNQQLISVGMDDSYTHILWADMGGSWSRVQQLSTSKGDRIPTVILRWVHNQHDMVKKNEFHFISGGNKVLSLWKIEGSTLTKKQARVGKKTNSQTTMTTYTALGNYHAKEGWKLCLGTANGDILTLEERELQLGVEKAHAKAIYALAEAEDGTFLITGGKDCFIKIWNQQLQLISTFDLNAVTSIDIFDASVLSLDILPTIVNVSMSSSSASAIDSSSASNGNNPFNTMTFLCGTGGGDILEFAVPATTTGPKALAPSSSEADGGANLPSRNFDLMKSVLSPVMDSHYKGELWGLAPHPENADIFATVGDDRILRIWSISRRRCLSAVALSRAARVIAWHPSGELLAVGLEEDRKANQKAKKGGSSSGKGGKKGGKGKAATRAGEEADAGASDAGNPYVVDEDGGSGGGRQRQGEPSVDETGGVRVFSVYFRGGVAAAHSVTTRPGTSSGASASTSNAPNGSGDEPLAVELHLRASGCFPKTHPQGTFTSVSDMKFSPAGDMLFVGGHDMSIHGYRLPAVSLDATSASQLGAWVDWCESLKKSEFDFQKHSSAITHFDISLDGKYLQSNDLACELLFYDILAKKQEVSATKMAEYHGRVEGDDEAAVFRRWLTQNTVFGWAVQGIWPANSYDSSEINTVDRSASGKYLATGEDSGQIRLLRYPSVVPSSKSVVLRGHSSHVTSVRWTLGEKLVSVGGNDKCVFIWELEEK